MKTRAQKTLAILILAFLPQVWASVELPPVLDGINEETRYISYLQAHIPWIFQEGTDYDRDLFDLVSMQSELIEALEDNPELKNAIESREGLIEIDAEFFEFVTNGEKRVADTNLTLQILNLAQAPLDRRLDRLTQQLKELASINLRGALTGLIKMLPPDQQKALFRLPPHEQFRRAKPLLESLGYLPYFPSKFAGSVLGLSQDQVTAEKVFAKIQKALQLELDTFVLMTSIGISQRQTAPSPNSVNQIASDPSWVDEISIKGYEAKNLRALYSSLSRPHVLTTAGDITKRPVDRITIREVPPHLGMFRGFAGGDCSTSYSGPFSFAAHEHTFFIYDSKNQLRGYAQGTRVQFNGKGDYFYLHDITGSRMAPQLMMKTMMAIAKAARALGFKGVLLPHANIITANQNFFDLREVQLEMVSGLPHGKISYLDAPSRQWIIRSLPTREINSRYDAPEANTIGHVYDSKESLDTVEVNVSVRSSHFALPDNFTPVTAALLYLSLTYPQRAVDSVNALQETIANADQGQAANYAIRRAAAEKIAQASHLDIEKLRAFEEDLRKGRLKHNQFFHSLKSAFKKLGIVIKESDLQHHMFLFHEAYLLSALKMPQETLDAKKIAEAALGLLHRWPEPKSVELFLAAHPSLLQDSGDLKRYVRSLVKTDRYSIRQLKWLLVDLDVGFLNPEVDIEKIQALIASHDRDPLLVELLRDIEDHFTKRQRASSALCRPKGR